MKNEKKQEATQVWIEDYDTGIQIIKPHSKDPLDINKQDKIVGIINAINSAYGINSNAEKQNKLGVLKFSDFGAIHVYLSKDKTSVYLHSDKGAKVMTTKNFYDLFKQMSKGEPIPPGAEPKSFPPLPKGEGLDPKDIEKLY